MAEANADSMHLMAEASKDLLHDLDESRAEIVEFLSDAAFWLACVIARALFLLLAVIIADLAFFAWRSHPSGNDRLWLLLAGVGVVAVVWQQRRRRRDNGPVASASPIASAISVAKPLPELSETDRQVVAFHEAGHALAAWHLPQLENPTEIRLGNLDEDGSAGHVGIPPIKLNLLTPAGLVYAYIVFAMAGRSAEKLLLDGDTSSGAHGDIAAIQHLARWLAEAHAVFGGRSFTHARAVIRAAQLDADDLITAHAPELRTLAEVLLEWTSADPGPVSLKGEDLTDLLNIHLGPPILAP